MARRQRNSSRAEFVIPMENEDNGNIYKDCTPFITDDGFGPSTSHQHQIQDHSITTNLGSSKSLELSSDSIIKESLSRTRSKPALGGRKQSGMNNPPNFVDSEEKKKKEKKIEFNWLRFVLLIGYACSIGFLAAGETIDEIRKIKFLGFELLKWDVFLVMVFSGIFVCSLFARLTRFLIELTFQFRSSQRMLALAHGYERDNMVFSWISWIFLCFIIWVSLFRHGEKYKIESQIIYYATFNLITLLVGSFLWLLKTLCVIKLASKFQVRAFLDKSLDALLNQYLLKALSVPSLTESEAEVVAETLPSVEKKRSCSSLVNRCLLKAISVWVEMLMKMKQMLIEAVFPMKKKHGSGRSRRLRELKGRVEELRVRVEALSKKDKHTLDSTLIFLVNSVINTELSIIDNPLDEAEKQREFVIRNEQGAEAAALRIFSNVAKSDARNRYIYKEEILRILPEEDVEYLFLLIKGTKSGRQISKKALKNWVIRAFKDQKALNASSNYTNRVVKQLNRFTERVMTVPIFVFWFLLMGFPWIQVLVTLLLGTSFFFGNTCKNVFEGIIFVLSRHPFDVGDICVIDAEMLRVEEVNIFTTIFLKVDNNEKVDYPNSILATKPISNCNRSSEMIETVELSIHIAGPPEQKIVLLKDKIHKYLKSTTKHGLTNFSLEVREIENKSKIKIALHCFRKVNIQNLKEKNNRKNKLVIDLKKILEEMKFLKFTIDIADPFIIRPTST